VSTLHQRLLDAISQHGGPLGVGTALGVVVKLHAPEPYSDHNPIAAAYLVCHGCDMSGYDADHPDYPCSTIQAIARELGVDGAS
jgi:hypothetical protein